MTTIRQAPGWWPALVQAVCNDCGWRGPVRNCYAAGGEQLAKIDAAYHLCHGKAGR